MVVKIIRYNKEFVQNYVRRIEGPLYSSVRYWHIWCNCPLYIHFHTSLFDKSLRCMVNVNLLSRFISNCCLHFLYLLRHLLQFPFDLFDFFWTISEVITENYRCALHKIRGKRNQHFSKINLSRRKHNQHFKMLFFKNKFIFLHIKLNF